MINKTKKYKSLILKIISILNDIIADINNNAKKQLLFSHSLTIKINPESKTLNFYMNDTFLSENEIKITNQNYFNDILKQLNEVLNKMHFINYHIRMIVLNEISNEILLELPSKSLKIPKFEEIPQNFGEYYGEKKLEKENLLIKNFIKEKDNYKIRLDLCYIYHNYTKYGTFDLLLFNDRLYNINLSKNEQIINELKNKMFFDLSDDNIYINFNKLKDSSINLFIYGNISIKRNGEENMDNSLINDNDVDITNFVSDSMSLMSEEFYERIKIFSENKQMNFYFDTIVNCLKDIYVNTSDQELFDVYSKLFEPTKDDPQYVHKKLSKNFLLCSSKK
jgi:hypothetical protein